MVEVVKAIWKSLRGDPVFMKHLNGWLTIFWVAMIPVSIFTGLINSVAYVSALSLWALVAGHWSTYQAARAEEAIVEGNKDSDGVVAAETTAVAANLDK